MLNELLAVPKRPAPAGRAANPTWLFENKMITGRLRPVSASLKAAELGLYEFINTHNMIGP